MHTTNPTAGNITILGGGRRPRRCWRVFFWKNENAPNGNVSGIARSQLGTKTPKPRTEIPIPTYSETRRSREIICDIHSSCEFFLCSIEQNFKKTAAFKSTRRAAFLSIIKGTINKNRPFRFDLTQKKRKCTIRPSSSSCTTRGLACLCGRGPRGADGTADSPRAGRCGDDSDVDGGDDGDDDVRR